MLLSRSNGLVLEQLCCDSCYLYSDWQKYNYNTSHKQASLIYSSQKRHLIPSYSMRLGRLFIRQSMIFYMEGRGGVGGRLAVVVGGDTLAVRTPEDAPTGIR
jgi:hypothetical protein